MPNSICAPPIPLLVRLAENLDLGGGEQMPLKITLRCSENLASHKRLIQGVVFWNPICAHKQKREAA
jgi:hypothetical protein